MEQNQSITRVILPLLEEIQAPKGYRHTLFSEKVKSTDKIFRKLNKSEKTICNLISKKRSQIETCWRHYLGGDIDPQGNNIKQKNNLESDITLLLLILFTSIGTYKVRFRAGNNIIEADEILALGCLFRDSVHLPYFDE